MRHYLLAVPILFLGVLAGCVWPPDSTSTPYLGYNGANASFAVQRTSQRSVSGVESLVTIVSPYDEYEYEYSDSVRYIIVNGDTAYRHPIPALPPSYDSSAPYKIDGSANFVTIVFASSLIIDTTYEADLTAQISSPAYGDTIQRTTDGLFSYQSNIESSGYQNGYLQLTDSINFYSQPLSYANDGTLDFTLYQMETFHTGTLWADLHIIETEAMNTYYDDYGYYNTQRQIIFDRIVAYPLH